MTGIEQRASTGLFREITLASLGIGRRTRERPKITIQFVELCGKVCKDLLGPRKSGKKNPSKLSSSSSSLQEEVRLVESDDGSVRILGARSEEVLSSNDVEKLITKGKTRRSTAATDVNGVSSRSHAVCQIEVCLPNVSFDGHPEVSCLFLLLVLFL